jgi:hypothetical protein
VVTKKDLENRLDELIAYIGKQTKEKCLALYDFGAIEPEEYMSNELGANALGSLLLTAALQDIVAKRLHIASNKTRKELKNLECF